MKVTMGVVLKVISMHLLQSRLGFLKISKCSAITTVAV
ncbi:hypothetical protein ACVWZ4_001122 [Bradyrhizobium sp. USDA 4472]